MASLILGVMGKKRAGKDTFAARLVDAHGFTRIGFADALKDVLLDLDPVVYVDAIGGEDHRLSEVLGPEADWETAKELPEVRRLLQALGVAVRDHLNEDVWVEAVIDKARRVPGPVVVTDVRFPNEADTIQGRGGKLVRVDRPASPGATSPADSHISETALDARVANYLVRNDGDIEQLHRFADGVARDALAYV